MRILGIDFGQKRIGLAITDESCTIATPLTTIICDDKEIDKINELVRTREVDGIVVGKPINMNGTISKGAEKIEEFVQKLRKVTDVPIEFRDERLTTREVERRLIESDLSRKKRKKKIDMLSACIILQSYIDNKSEKSI